MKTCPSNNKNTFKRGLFTVFYAALILAFLLISTAKSWLPVIGRWFFVPPNAAKADVIAVLDGGGPERLCHGMELYKRGLAPELWYTGDKPLETRSDFMDSEQVLNFAERYGVPKDKIRLLPSTSTFEDGQSISALVKEKKIKSLIVVTSWYHTRRAMNVIRPSMPGTNIVIYMSSSTNLPYTPDNWWQDEEGLVAVINETIKTALYWWRYGLAPW
ncbi:YdcF family protein [Verrucomicrobiota bacterium]